MRFLSASAEEPGERAREPLKPAHVALLEGVRSRVLDVERPDNGARDQDGDDQLRAGGVLVGEVARIGCDVVETTVLPERTAAPVSPWSVGKVG